MLSNYFRWSARWTLFFFTALVGVFAWKWAAGTLRVSAEWLPALALCALIAPFAGGMLFGGLMALIVPPSLRQAFHIAPEKVVIQFFRRRFLEAEHLAALRIDA